MILTMTPFHLVADDGWPILIIAIIVIIVLSFIFEKKDKKPPLDKSDNL